MSDLLLGIVIFIVFIIGPFWLIKIMQKRIEQKGNLFTGQATGGMRVLAILLGVFFVGLFIMEWQSSERIHIIFPVIGVALIGYGLGAGKLLTTLQGAEDNIQDAAQPPKKEESIIEWANTQKEDLKPSSPNRVMADKKCPRCGLWSVGSALRCDCGYDFEKNTVG